jgi:FMN-dependent NADH-azoreductase
MKLLHIDSSPLGNNSVSRRLTAAVVAEYRAANPGATVERLDLAADAPRHLDMDSLGFKLGLSDESLTPAQKRENAISERLVSQFLAADVVVIGAPMYNFTIPTQLKAWLDRVAQAGRTFKYTESGPVGLAGDKTVVVVSSRGGMYHGLPHEAAMDHQESYLKTIFGFFGVTDLRFVRAEGAAMGDEAKARGIAAAEADIKRQVAEEEEAVAA